jgi:hypothetical protein
MAAHKIGTKVVFSNGEALHDVTNGKEYTIAGIDWDGDEYFIDDAGERNYAAASGDSRLGEGDGVYTIVTEQ